MYRYKILPYLIISLFFVTFSCKKDEEVLPDDDSVTTQSVEKHTISLKFDHFYKSTVVSASDFGTLKYQNVNGEHHSITKMRYMISDLKLYKSDGNFVDISGYHLIDLTDANSLIYNATTPIAEGDFVAVGFTFGFDTLKNVDGSYPDLNAANWNWPAMLGGGYHYMQFEGRFIDNNTDTTGFAYHNGKARDTSSGTNTFLNNDVDFKISHSGFTVDKDLCITLKMDIHEWFQNPYTWDLNQYNSVLMPNYTAQLLMHDNAATVFSLGAIQ